MFVFEVDVIAAVKDGHRVVEVLRGGAVVQSQALGAPDDGHAIPAEDRTRAVDTLVRVLCDEQVVRVFPDEHTKKLPVGWREILAFVDEHVIGMPVGLPRQVRGSYHGGLGEVEAAVNPALRTVGGDQRPQGGTLRTVEGNSASGAAYPQVGGLVVDLVGEHDVGILGGEERLVGELVGQGGAGRLDDLAPSRTDGARDRRGAFLTKNIAHRGDQAAAGLAQHGGERVDACHVDAGLAECPCLGYVWVELGEGVAERFCEVGGERGQFDLFSSRVKGRRCPLAAGGYSRDGKNGTLQIEYGLLTDPAGRPVAVRVFAGDTGDPTAFVSAVQVVRDKFRLTDLVMVGDRGMITSARIDALKQHTELGWLTCLRAPAIGKLAAEDGPLQMTLFDQHDLAEISHPDYPGEPGSLPQPLLAAERTRKRQELLAASEALLDPLAAAVRDGRLRGAAAIGLKVARSSTSTRWPNTSS